jgi:hypothetical protein
MLSSNAQSAASLESICHELSSSIKDSDTLKKFSCDFKILSQKESESSETPGKICQDYANRTLGLPKLPNITRPESSKITLLPDGRVQIRVEHGVIAKVTLKEMGWWYRNLANPKVLKNKSNNCLPYIILDADHIGVKAKDVLPSGEIKAGSTIHVEEMTHFANKAYHLEEDLLISEITDKYMRQEKRKLFGISLGVTLGQTDRYFTEENGGVRVVSILTAGIDSKKHPKLSNLNKILIKKLFPSGNQNAWINHTTEEVSNLTVFIPWLLSKQPK